MLVICSMRGPVILKVLRILGLGSSPVRSSSSDGRNSSSEMSSISNWLWRFSKCGRKTLYSSSVDSSSGSGSGRFCLAS